MTFNSLEVNLGNLHEAPYKKRNSFFYFHHNLTENQGKQKATKENIKV